jgi:hypothetical protein
MSRHVAHEARVVVERSEARDRGAGAPAAGASNSAASADPVAAVEYCGKSGSAITSRTPRSSSRRSAVSSDGRP